MRFLVTLTSFFLLTSTVSSHSFFESPGARQKNGATHLAKGASCPCNNKMEQANPSAVIRKRGETVKYQYPRNNHRGGFVQLAVVPFNQSDLSQQLYDQNIFWYHCFQTDCKSYAGTEAGGDHDRTEHSNKCHAQFTLPDWLPDGQWTIQWRWFLGGDSGGKPNAALSTFQSCEDFTVAGGNPVKPETDKCATFKGGDLKTSLTPDLADKNQCWFLRPNGFTEIVPDFEYEAMGQYEFGKPKIMNKECAAGSQAQPQPESYPQTQPEAQPEPQPQPGSQQSHLKSGKQTSDNTESHKNSNMYRDDITNKGIEQPKGISESKGQTKPPTESNPVYKEEQTQPKQVENTSFNTSYDGLKHRCKRKKMTRRALRKRLH